MTSIYLATDTSIGTALTNTLIGMGTVFVALIVISFIIALLKPISDLITGGFKKKVVAPVEEKVKAEQVVATEVDMNSETELVAVITAAIMASYQDNNYTSDGLVVRKIRRLSK